jgi:DNA-directed RNA polymerase specialized sigma24 family protein
MNSDTDLAAAIPTGIASFDFEVVFQTQYTGIARVIAQVVGDRARAEELSAEVFYRLWRADAQKVRNVGGWLQRHPTNLYPR